MKQSDLFAVIIIATVGVIASFLIVNNFMGDPNLERVKVTTVNTISPNVEEPDPELFNPAAINPTVEVYVGDCEDIDRNGIISHEELVACGKIVETETPEKQNPTPTPEPENNEEE